MSDNEEMTREGFGRKWVEVTRAVGDVFQMLDGNNWKD
jgi:hypothetical protein